VGDKAYISKKLQKQAKLQGKEMITSKKKPRGGKFSNTELARKFPKHVRLLKAVLHAFRVEQVPEKPIWCTRHAD